MSWLQRKFSRKLTFLFCSLVLITVVVPGYLVNQLVRKQSIDDLTVSLTQQAQLLASQMEPEFFHGLPGHAALRIKQIHDICGCRVTLIRSDGTVMEESDVPTAELSRLENHADRVEVKAALAGKPGHSIRHSATLNEDMLYTAVPFQMGSLITGVIRLALPLTGIKMKLRDIRRRLTLIALGMLLVAWLLSMALARSISRPVQDISAVAEKLGQGQFQSRVSRPGVGEVGQLGQTLNSLADRVENQIKIISEEKSQLSAVLSNMTDGVAVIDVEGRVVLVNPALSEFFGIDAAVTNGKFFIEVLRESKLSEILERVRKDLTIQIDEVRTFSNDERTFEVHGVPVLTDGVYIGAMLVLHDITKIRRLEQVRRDFIANVSHELRTPLSAIKGFAETLLSGGLEDAKNRLGFVKSIEQHGNRMATLIGDLLDLTAIESGQRPPQKKLFSVADLVSEVVHQFSGAAQKKHIVLEHLPLEEGLLLSADRGQIHQVLSNLVENALKFTSNGGKIAIAATGSDTKIELSVKDSGMGIPSQDLPRIFERFYRVDKARSREMGGTGLGLSIVKHIIEAHGGSIHVESQIGKGSVFTVSLPIH